MNRLAASGIAVVGCLGLLAAPGYAETIYDPENPGMVDEDDDGDDADEPDDSMIIDDPERPDLPERHEPDDEVDDEPAVDPRYDTSWGVNWELGTLVDPGIGPAGRDRFEISGGTGMELRHELSVRTALNLSGRLNYWAGAGRQFDDWRTHYEPRLDRAYLVHRPDRWSFAVGKMRNSWGSTDIIRPGDVIDPVDMRDPAGGGGLGTGLGQLSATASYTGADDWGIRAVLVPFYRSNRVDLFGRDTSLAHERNPIIGEQLPFLLLAEQLLDPSIHQETQPFLQSTTRPLDLPMNASGGLRGTWTVAGTDLGLGVFYGWDRTPEVILDDDLRALMNLLAEDEQIFEDFDFAGFLQRNPEAFDHSQNLSEKAEAGETIFESRIRRRATAVADFARYVGPIGVRADVAFSPRRVFYTETLQAVRRASVFSALGLSYERLLDGTRPLAVTMEGFWFHPFAADSGLTRLLVAEEERGDPEDELLLFEGGYYGLAAAVDWATGLWDLEVTAGAIASISPGDLMWQASIERHWTSSIYTRLGGRMFVGPDPADRLTPGGLWDHADRVVLSVGGRY